MCQANPSLNCSEYCSVGGLAAVLTLDAGTSSTVSRVGENAGPRPAPAKIVPPGSWTLDFHLRLTRNPRWGSITVWTKAALGENVPPRPPLSFQAISCSGLLGSLMKMPRSWLKPLVAVHRSEFACTMASAFAVAGMSRTRPVVSIAVHDWLVGSEYCFVLKIVWSLDPVSTSRAVSRVGENTGPVPAP